MAKVSYLFTGVNIGMSQDRNDYTRPIFNIIAGSFLD